MKLVNSICLLLFFGLVVAATIPEKTESYASLTPAELAGKKIYTKGIGSSSEKIMANMSGVQVPATVMPCMNCHSANGKGNPEGGIVPSNVTWSELTKSYGGQRQDGSKYPAYTDQSLRKAISMGIDPGGNELHASMPKYTMSRTDMNNLIAYMKTLGESTTTGSTNHPIKIGVALAKSNENNTAFNEVLRSTIEAYCDKVNKNGGVFTRSIEPNFFSIDEHSTEVGEYIEEQNFMAVVGVGLQNEISAIAKESKAKETPIVFNYAQTGIQDGIRNPYAFYLYPSLVSQGKALADFSRSLNTKKQSKQIAILYQTNEQKYSYVAEGIRSYYTSSFGIEPDVYTTKSIDSLVKASYFSDETVIFYLGAGTSGNHLISSLDEATTYPTVLVPGSLSYLNMMTIPSRFKSKVFIGYPTWMSERSASGIMSYKSLQEEYQLSKRFKGNQLDALSMLMTLESCLKDIGKDVTKEKVRETMEQLYEFSSGLGPALTYTLNDRVGSSKIYIAGFDSGSSGVKLIGVINSPN